MGAIFSLVVITGFMVLIGKVIFKPNTVFKPTNRIGTVVLIKHGKFNPIPNGIPDFIEKVKITNISGSLIEGIILSTNKKVLFTPSEIVSGESLSIVN